MNTAGCFDKVTVMIHGRSDIDLNGFQWIVEMLQHSVIPIRICTGYVPFKSLPVNAVCQLYYKLIDMTMQHTL